MLEVHTDDKNDSNNAMPRADTLEIAVFFVCVHGYLVFVRQDWTPQHYRILHFALKCSFVISII